MIGLGIGLPEHLAEWVTEVQWKSILACDFRRPPRGWTLYYAQDSMHKVLRFLWNATRGHHFTPWRSPYLLWRIETYTGVKMTQIGFLEFWEFSWRERKNLWRFLKWTGEMERYAHPRPKTG